MALAFGTQGELNTINGVYQGQTSPVIIGAVNGRVGPNYYGYTIGDKSITFNTYFDPSQSGRPPMMSWDKIGYIQAGIFYLNGVPVSVLVHDDDTLLPVTSLRAIDFTDTPRIVGDNGINSDPSYPAWAMQGRSDVSPANLFRYPQEYGGFTKYNGSNFAANAFLAASLNKNIVLGAGDLLTQKPTVPDFFRQLDFSGLNVSFSFGFDLDESIDVKTITGSLILNKCLPDLGDLLSYFDFTHADTGRTIAYSYPLMTARGSQIVFSAFTLTGGNFYRIDYEDVIDFVEDTEDMPLDIEHVRDILLDKTGIFYFFGSSARVKITYHHVAYPCAIREGAIQDRLEVQRLEGIEWAVSQTSTNGVWEDPVVSGPRSPSLQSKLKWSDAVNGFLSKTSGYRLYLRYTKKL